MKPVPDVEISGTVTRFNLESAPDGSAVLVVYADNEDGTISRAWLEFAPESTRALRAAAGRLRAGTEE
ncbi:hypothetical protein [Streptomyces sp. NBC_01565]|uniref:hypothetical protein n=1 Tax=Streptomyces sp. NBC_01565 TaxID=2975881 RepID=UPI002257F0B1|nr:hypothetical protein [Streptomyces sp. NBC_01565]MCX4547230.1 hypothetical protein [Streptomyces sp. NBC_01565]